MSASNTPAGTSLKPAPASSSVPDGRTRKRALLALVLVFLSIAAVYGAYWFLVARWRESTNDAYVAGHVVQITPQVGGTVKAVFVDDTDKVAAGETLVELDDADSRVALDQAESTLAQAVREVRVLKVRNDALRAEVAVRQTEVDRLTADVSRRMEIAQRGFVSREDFDHTQEALRMARSALIASKEQLTANRVLTEGTEIENHPGVLGAAARVEEAWLAWSRSHIVAPVAGQVAKRNVQVGQRVAAGTPLMAVISLDQLWVEANFKEVQLGQMRIGQAVTLTADYYGSRVRYRGRVAGLAAGTGSAFALLPAQNATGNWIKVVQRVPVRVELAPEDLAAHPLRIGLSMEVTVDIHANGGVAIAEAAGIANTDTADTANAGEEPKSRTTAGPSASGDALTQARIRIAEIIRKHSGVSSGPEGQ
ncbi:MAG: efflux RND transporter periplasmic adaptor subunit [Azoarcus sp.]|jgi:membrane fusion protein (multidrug efflux system)|nr:efflux RND transporter periplasmic adaptor subunit [Azoarcus sp.]